MPLDDDDDASRAELDYIETRVEELIHDAAQGLTALSGNAVTPEDVANMLGGVPIGERIATFGSFVPVVTATLRRSGNDALADTYAAAWERVLAAAQRVEHFRPDVNDAAVEEFDEAFEAFERVTADMSAWFKKLAEEGDA